MRVLFLTHRLPFPPNRGDRIRAFNIIGSLARHADVEVVSLVHDDDERAQVGSLRRHFDIRVTPLPVPYLRTRAAAMLALAGTRRPLTHVLLDSPDAATALRAIVDERPPDVVLAYCSGMAKFALRAPLDRFPLVVDLVDLDSAKWAAMAEESRPPMRWIYERESRHLGAFERSAVLRAHASLVVNEREAAAVRRLEPRANVQVVPNGVELDTFAASGPPAEEPRVVFCGVMNYAPNVHAVSWFVREVWPEVRRICPAATFAIVGADPADAVLRLANPDLGIEVTGRVPETAPYLWRAAVSIAPLRIARGVQNKVLEAVAAGLPAVVTTDVFDGLPNEVRGACRVADTADEFARQTVRLLRLTGAERRAIAGRADCVALSWQRQMTPLTGVLADAMSLTLPARSDDEALSAPSQQRAFQQQV